MHCHEVDLPERDKLAAGKGLVSDVFLYYPKGIIFPVFVEKEMQEVTIQPGIAGEYEMSFPVFPGTDMIVTGPNTDLFASVVDKAREIAIKNGTGGHTGNRQLQPA